MVLLSILNSTAIFDQLKIMTEFCAIKISKESIDYACTACRGCLPSLVSTERMVLSQAMAKGYSLSRSCSKKCRSGKIRNVWLVCGHTGRYKNR